MTQILERGFTFTSLGFLFEFIFLEYFYAFLQAVEVSSILFYASSSQDLKIRGTDSVAHLYMDVYKIVTLWKIKHT